MSTQPATPTAPRHLSDHSRQLWRRLHGEYDFSSAASEVLRLGLEALDRAESCREQVARDGLMVGSRYDGVDRLHPAVAAERDARIGALRCFTALDLELDEDATKLAPPRPLRAPRFQVRPPVPLDEF